MKPLTLCLAALVILATSCTDTNAPEGDPPVLPPSTSFVIDFADFAAPELADATGVFARQAGANWRRSAVVVGVWNIALTVTLVVPVAAFVESFRHQPEGRDGAWVWPYDFNALGASYSARLEARPVSAGVQWDMFISRDGDYTDFNWYSGQSNLTGTSGTWSLNRMPNDPTPFIDIEWNRVVGEDTYDIRYTNVIPGDAENGGYIQHGITGASPYDAFYQIFSANNNNLTEIEWSRSNKEGRVRDPMFYSDSDWRCWDTNLDDIACP